MMPIIRPDGSASVAGAETERARELLERIGVAGAQDYTRCELAPLTSLLVQLDYLEEMLAEPDTSHHKHRMQWRCRLQGCFNSRKRLKFGAFDGVFSARRSFSDIDAIIEINGHALVMEWKQSQGTLPIGQHIMFERLTRSCPLTVIVVDGDAETMTVRAMMVYKCGVISEPWRPADMDALRERLRQWNYVADHAPIDTARQHG